MIKDIFHTEDAPSAPTLQNISQHIYECTHTYRNSVSFCVSALKCIKLVVLGGNELRPQTAVTC